MLKNFLKRMASSRWATAGGIFTMVTLVLGLVGKSLAFAREDIMMINLFHTYPMNLAKIFTEGWTGLFGNQFPWINWSYRPLEMTIDWGLIKIFGTSETAQIIFKSAVVGLCAALAYFLLREITRKRGMALTSAALFAFSVPVIIEGWWFHHMVAYTEVAILLGLLAYLRFETAGRAGWLAVFWVCGLAAPLLGEYSLSLPIIALLYSANEWFVHRNRSWKAPLSAFVLLLVALFPQLLPNLIISHRFVLDSVFSRGFQDIAGAGALTGPVNPGLPYSLIMGALTPIITVLGFVSLLVFYIRRRKDYNNIVIMAAGLLCILGAIMARNFPPPETPWGEVFSVPFDFYYVLPLLFPVLFAVLSWRLNPFLVIWFLVSYIPFIKIHFLSVNLIPAILPWIALQVWWISSLAEDFELKRIFKFGQKPIRAGAASVLIVVVLLGIGGVSQISNIVTARETWGTMVDNTRAMGQFTARNLPAGSIVLGEETGFFESLDLAYYSQGKAAGNIVNYYDYRWWPLNQLTKVELPSFFSANTTCPAKYILLQGNVPQVLDTYRQVNPAQFEKVSTFQVRSRVILVDPLYLVLPERLPYYTGFNIVRIQSSGGGPFYADYSENYTLYRYISGGMAAK